MRVYVTGFMGAGKTVVGRRVAERLGLEFVDLDQRIEQSTGGPVSGIFETVGELGFRRLEAEALAATLDLEDVVVATGGGALVSAQNRALVAGAEATTVWLKPEFSTIMQRIEEHGTGDRPLFADRATAEALYRDRIDAYGKAADHVVEIGPDDGVDDVADRLFDILRQPA